MIESGSSLSEGLWSVDRIDVQVWHELVVRVSFLVHENFLLRRRFFDEIFILFFLTDDT